MREEYEPRAGWGRRTLTEDVPLPFPVAAAIRFDEQARFHVRKYLLPLLKDVAGGGSHVFEQTRVVDVHDGAPCRVETETGVVTAQDVIVATHVPLNKLFIQTKLAHYRSYVLACRTSGKVPEGLFWDDEDPTTTSGPRRRRRDAAHRRGQRPQGGPVYETELLPRCSITPRPIRVLGGSLPLAAQVGAG